MRRDIKCSLRHGALQGYSPLQYIHGLRGDKMGKYSRNNCSLFHAGRPSYYTQRETKAVSKLWHSISNNQINMITAAMNKSTDAETAEIFFIQSSKIFSVLVINFVRR